MDAYSYIFAYGRYARVQAVSWGHPDTTGIPNLDYFISSKRLEAPGAQAHYTERLVQLSNLPAYYPRPAAVGAVNRGKYGFMRDAKLYGCPQSLFKFHPEFDAHLAGILRTDPKGIIVIPAGMPVWRELLRNRMKTSMSDVIHRVRFIDQVPEAQFLEFLKMMDVLLDPIHFGGGNTAYEAISVATPTVTWPGEFMRARVTAGAYDQMGFHDLIAQDAAGYVERAVRVANDDAYRAQCVAAIEDGSQRVFDDSSFVREFEAFCVDAYARS
jgi:protein O-GlcNAc transferase